MDSNILDDAISYLAKGERPFSGNYSREIKVLLVVNAAYRGEFSDIINPSLLESDNYLDFIAKVNGCAYQAKAPKYQMPKVQGIRL